MPKISIIKANGVIVKFVFKIILLSLIFVLTLNSLLSFLLLKIDIDLEICKYLGVLICFISAFIISYFSIGGFKTNLIVVSLISIFPLLLFVIINYCVNGGEIYLLLIKVALITVTACISSIIRLKHRSK